MHNHFDHFLNLKSIILKNRPNVIVECGAGNGELTEKIASLLDTYFFEFYVISDKKIEGMHPSIHWIDGLSYEALEEFKDGEIDMCIIDTDHNYWTLMKELAVLFPRMSEGGLIALHDVATFYHDTGMALSYWNDKPYPKEEIEKYAPYGSLGDALMEFLHLKKMSYRLISFTSESHGAALIGKRTQTHFNIMTPGPGAVFASNKKMEVANAGN